MCPQTDIDWCMLYYLIFAALFCPMSQPAHGNFHDDVQDDHEYLDSSVEILMMKIMSNAHSHSSGFGHLSSLEVIFF